MIFALGCEIPQRDSVGRTDAIDRSVYDSGKDVGERPRPRAPGLTNAVADEDVPEQSGENGSPSNGEREDGGRDRS